MRFLIWGAGAIGGTIGAYWVRAGHDVTFVDVAAAHVAAINNKGLHISGPVDSFSVQAPAFTPQELDGQYQHVCLCVKAHHTADALEQLLPHLAPDGYVLSLQNGLNELLIAERIGQERTVGAFINFGADYLEPGLIHRGNRAAVVVGELDGQLTPRARTLHECLLQFDDRAILTDNIMGYLWGKLAYGAQLFVTALTSDSIADALDNPRFRALYVAVAKEVMLTAQAYGITPQGFDGFNPLAFLPDTPLEVSQQSLDQLVTFNRGSAKTHSGIWRDLAIRKRKTEVDAMLGMIVRQADAKGIAVPLLRQVIVLIHEIESGKRRQNDAALEELLKHHQVG
jgi:2-dehydropantoate 2-reductase